jgi:hypothetical protein
VSTTVTRAFTLDSRDSSPRLARHLVFALDNTNGYSAGIEPGARIGHARALGGGALVFTGMQMAFGPATGAVFPGVNQLGDGVSPAGGPSRPKDYAAGGAVFTLKALGTGTLYQGTMTWWGEAGAFFSFSYGVPPLPGNPNLASAAFDLTEILR